MPRGSHLLPPGHSDTAVRLELGEGVPQLLALRPKLSAQRASSRPGDRCDDPKKGRKQGRKEGRTPGLLEGQRMALAEQAKEKLGDLEARFVRLIEEASRDQLRQWLKNILKATAPEELFRS